MSHIPIIPPNVKLLRHHATSTTMRLLAGALRDSPGSSEQAAVNGWLGRADRRYSRTLAPPPPGRPAFTTLRSSGQWVHVHRTNIASFGPPRGSRWRWIGAPFRRVVEADVGEECLFTEFRLSVRSCSRRS